MTAKALDDSWRAWVKENIARRCDPEELVRILLRHEFSIESIREAMGQHFPAASVARSQPFVPRQLDDSWRGWLKENLERQCNPEELVQILLQHDFSLEAIRQAMEDKFPGASPLVNVLMRQEPSAKGEAISRPPLTRKTIPGLRRVETDKLQLYLLDDFLTLAECDGLITLIDQNLRPSTITFGDSYFRTSRTCDLSLISSPLVASVDEKIARAIG